MPKSNTFLVGTDARWQMPDVVTEEALQEAQKAADRKEKKKWRICKENDSGLWMLMLMLTPTGGAVKRMTVAGLSCVTH